MNKIRLDKDNVWNIYTDGSCIVNPGPGGYGIYAICDEEEFELQGGEAHTTNNRMEMMAAITALEHFDQPSKIHIITDCEYVQLGMTNWLVRWKRNGWRASNRKPVKNRDLWERLDAAAQHHEVQWICVRGHDGNPGNERAHSLAEEAARAQAASRGEGGHYAICT